MPEPDIYLYGSIHSPWCQAVLLTLHMKKLKYTFSSTIDPQTIVESYKQGVPTPMWFPALWYNGKCYYESSNIIELLDFKHPSKISLFFNFTEEQVTLNLSYIWKLFAYAFTRVAGWKKLRFWYEWSIQKDNSRSKTHKILSCFFRPFTTLYFWTLLNIAFHIAFKGKWPEQSFRKSILYFSQILEKSPGPYLNGSDVTYIDIVLLGHFQCMFSGSTTFGALSEEVIPIIDEYPKIWEWLRHMHEHYSLVDFPYMYSKCYMIQRSKTSYDNVKMFAKEEVEQTHSLVSPRGSRVLPSVVEEDVFGQVLYWLGLIFMITFWPATVLALLLALGTRMWKLGGTFENPMFRFNYKKIN